MDYRGGDHQTLDQDCFWLFCCRSKSVGAVWTAAYRLYACSVCATKAPLQLQCAAYGAI